MLISLMKKQAVIVSKETEARGKNRTQFFFHFFSFLSSLHLLQVAGTTHLPPPTQHTHWIQDRF